MWARREILVIAAIVSLTLAGSAVVFVASSSPSSGLIPFHSYGELSDFLNAARSSLQTTRGGALFAGPASPAVGNQMGAPATAPTTGAPSYSGTNVQVAGVDELDMVKTDGTYLYLASSSEVDVFLAYPAASMHLVSRIELANLTTATPDANTTVWASGLFLDGSTLVVVAQAYTYSYGYGYAKPAPMMMPATVAIYPAPARTLAFLFDVSDPASPVLLHTLSVTGSPSSGRMVNGTIYLVSTQWILQLNGTYGLPQTCLDATCTNLSADQVYHDPQSEDSWDYTNILAIDTGTAASRVTSIVTGGYTVLYMSPMSMYLAFFKWAATPMGIATPLMPTQVGNGWTTIYKLQASGLDVEAVAVGNVAGSLLSQYSMDEWRGYLRVATTERSFAMGTSSSANGVYVFDGGMHLVGAISDLAPGESIFAVRFVDDKAYVVTFRKIDPLFVIDLADPTAPSVSGFLEMPGFSDYLYPLDAGHLVGLGKDATPAVEGNWSWYQGLKLALYNVTDPTAPSETANVTVGDRGSDSEALYDPHAFLYVPDRQLVVVPVDLAIVNASQYPDGVPQWAWGTVVWQGVYLFHVDATTGIQTLGRVSQDNGTINATCGWYGSPNEIRRSLYIGDVLYTISGTAVQANSLTDLSMISKVVYATPQVSPYYGCPVIAGPVPAV